MRMLNACTRVLTREIGACDTRIRGVSHVFTVELVAGLYRIMAVMVHTVLIVIIVIFL